MADERLNALTPEAYSELAAEVRRIILGRSQAAHSWDEGMMTASIRAGVRRRIIDEILEKDMELREANIDASDV